VADCRALGIHTIVAQITSDKTGGLAFYSKLGFTDIEVIANDHVRRSSYAVDRIIKHYPLV